MYRHISGISKKVFMMLWIEINNNLWPRFSETLGLITNKEILLIANSCVADGNNEGFLSFCTENVVWEFIGDRILVGKAAVRTYMNTEYVEPPKFDVEHLIADGDFVSSIGKISVKDKIGTIINYSYCDVWQFHEGKMAALRAFVIKTSH